jgi:hypothetical protein
MSKIDITVNNKRNTVDSRNETRAYDGDGHLVAQRLSKLMGSLDAGVEGQTMSIQIDNGNGVQAHGTFTLSSVVAGDSLIVGAQTFLASATPTGHNQFLVGVSDAATATNLAAAINANPSLADVVTASASGAVVTVTSKYWSDVANNIPISGDLAGSNGLGLAASYGVIADSTITNTGATAITGSLALSPGTSVTGFPPGTVSGTQDIANTNASSAQAALLASYTALSALPSSHDYSGTNMGTLTLTPGVYKWTSSAALTGTMTLNGAGQYVFQIGSTLTVASAGSVALTNGATAANVFFLVGSSATVGTTATMAGNIEAVASITLNTGASLNGRAMAQTGAVTLADNAITVPVMNPSIVASGAFLTGGVSPSANSYVFGGNL